MTDRYDTHGNLEGQYQSNSNNQVLSNKLAITDADEMNMVELDLLELLYERVLAEVTEDQIITVTDLMEWHRAWLGNVYDWAGRERSVNMGKGDFHFAACSQIPRLLADLDNKYLAVYTPCKDFTEVEFAEAISIIHVEFILVHPFREGNGRLSRLLANVMALQANWPELDFTAWDNKKEMYFSAIQAGMECNYEPLKLLVMQVLHDSENAFF